MPTSLDALRDIHLPEPVSWWPLAFGYWLLLALLLVGAIVWFRRYRRFAIRRAASRELKQLLADYAQHGNALELARSVNVMLRRTLLSLEPRHEVAALTGERWINCVHACVADSGFTFSDGVQKLLTEDIYKPGGRPDADTLAKECREWVRRLPPRAAA